MQRSRGSGRGVVLSKISYNTVIVLSVVLSDCCKPTNHCWDWAFSKSELDVWLPAFQLPMFPKCDALPKGDLLDMFVSGIHAFCKIYASSWEPRTFRHLCIKSWLHHAHPLVAAAEKDCVMKRSRGSGHRVVVSEICTIQWLCSQLCYETAATSEQLSRFRF